MIAEIHDAFIIWIDMISIFKKIYRHERLGFIHSMEEAKFSFRLVLKWGKQSRLTTLVHLRFQTKES